MGIFRVADASMRLQGHGCHAIALRHRLQPDDLRALQIVGILRSCSDGRRSDCPSIIQDHPGILRRSLTLDDFEHGSFRQLYVKSSAISSGNQTLAVGKLWNIPIFQKVNSLEMGDIPSSIAQLPRSSQIPTLAIRIDPQPPGPPAATGKLHA